MNEKKTRSSFTGSIGFVLAAAGSAVGLGNLWRFPYLAAKNGGGLFIVVYIVLALTFGFTLMTTEIAIGRKTGLSSISAYKSLDKRFGFLGYIAAIVPLLILPYYSVIGGWVCKYAFTYLTGQGKETTADGYFSSFITSDFAPILWFLLFVALTSAVVFLGVDKGIEKASRYLMPTLIILIIGISIYSLTLSFTDSMGNTRTALQGLKIYLVPDFTGMTVSRFLRVVLDAMGQMFYSMSIAMGILVTYGSYTKKDTNLVTSVNQIEIFDTGVALLAGMIMIPAVFTFQGTDGLTAVGPSLLFISMPKVFAAMGGIGNFIGTLFFILVIFAALTSSISLMEAIVSMAMDKLLFSRKKSCITILISCLVIGLITCFGYTLWYFELALPNHTVGQILDVLDYFTNSLLMPIVAIATCILVGFIVKPKAVVDEVKLGNRKFDREKLYIVVVKYIAPVLLLIILLQAFGTFDFLG